MRTRQQLADDFAQALRPVMPGGRIETSEEVGLINQLADLVLKRESAAQREKLFLRHPTSLRDPAAFYGALRGPLFNGSIKQSQVEGIEALLRAMGEAGWPIAYAAYGFATAYHETARTMQPIKEYGGTAYFHRMYDIAGDRPQKARELGNVSPGDGARFVGRGYVQLTGRTNYAKAGTKIGVDLVSDPDKAMDCVIAAKIMVCGMAEGWFTGRSLKDYLPATVPASEAQFREARRIINGTDKSHKIAGEAMLFQFALKAGAWG